MLLLFAVEGRQSLIANAGTFRQAWSRLGGNRL